MLFNHVYEQLLDHLTYIATYISEIAIRKASFLTVVKNILLILFYHLYTMELLTDIITYLAANIVMHNYIAL